MQTQIPVQELPFGPYSVRVRAWSPVYPDVLTVERDSDTGYRYVVLGCTDPEEDTGNSLSTVLGVSLTSVLEYLDETVVQGREPPGDKLYNRWYNTVTVQGIEYYVADWKFLYHITEVLGDYPGV